MRKRKVIAYYIENDCWICISHISNHHKYPQITRNRKGMSMHKFMYELYFNKIPKNMVARHTCDNPLCINPNHVKIGSQSDNMQDMIKRGRLGKRIKPGGGSKLTDQQFFEIRESNIPQKDLAVLYSVSNSTISYIKNKAKIRGSD